jgi:release factor glutamine methyltransferase
MTETELLFTQVLGCSRLELYQNKTFALNREASLAIASALKRRIKHEPIQYVLGEAHFFGLRFKVDRDCLIPRQETEILVETAVRYARRLPHIAYRILELGTGSGCIAVSLAKSLPDAKITATDISQEALAIAKENARNNELDGKIKFIQSDLFSDHELRAMSYELIISNPPYVASDEIKDLQPEISYEPGIALDGGEDGLDFYRRIIQDSPAHLEEGGYLILEMGIGQRPQIEKIFQKSEKFEIIGVVKDYNHIERVIVAQRKKHG